MTESGGDTESATIELPEKTYFKIGEVAKLLDVEPYVLRYWETEFDVLDPEKTKSGQRVYQRHDIELLMQIQTLLYEEMFTIAGARRQIARRQQGKSSYFDLDEQSRPSAQGTAVAGDEQLREQLEEARRELAAAETKLNERQQQLDEVTSEASKLEERLDDVRAELEQTHQKLESARETNDELNARITELENRLENQSEREDGETAAELRERIEQLEQQLEQVRSDADEQQSVLRRKVDDRRRRRRDLLGSLRREVESISALADTESRQLG